MRQVLTVSWQIHWHAVQMSDKVEWPLWSYIPSKTPYRISPWLKTIHPFGVVSCGTIDEGVWRSRNRQHPWKESCRTTANWMGSTHRLWTKERKKTGVLCWIEQARRLGKTGFISHTTYERVHRFNRKSHIIFLVRRQQWVLVSEKKREGPWKNDYHFTTRTLRIYISMIWIAKRIWHISPHFRWYTVSFKMANCLSLPRWHRHFFKVTRTAHRSHTKGVNSTQNRGRDLQT